MTDLKRALMELGNRLVTKHGFEPGVPASKVSPNWYAQRNTSPLMLLAEYLNAHPEAREELRAMGLAWPVVGGEA